MTTWTLRNPQALFLRLYDPGIDYHRVPLITSDCVYLPSERTVFTVVKQDASDLSSGWADRPWAYPMEVRLLAAIALSVPEGCGSLAFAPIGPHKVLDLPYDAPLDSDEALEHVSTHARDWTAEVFGDPPVYALRDAEYSGGDFQQRLYAGIDPTRALLIRSLYALLKSQHMARYADGVFFEEATMNVQIAREGAIQLLSDLIGKPGRKRPSEKDVFAYLRSNFRAGEALAAFLEQQRQVWTKMKHPRSNLGVFWAPPLEADDFFETYEAVVSMFRHIVTGEPGREDSCL